MWFTIPAVFRNLYFRLETAFASEIAQVDASQWAATRLSKAYTAPLYVYFLLIIKAPLLNFGTTSLQSTDYFCCNARFGDASCRYFVSIIPMSFDILPVDSVGLLMARACYFFRLRSKSFIRTHRAVRFQQEIA